MDHNNKKDRLIRGIAMDGKVRAFAVRTTQLVEELRRRHDTYPTATAAMGRTVTAAAMMGAMLKGEDKLTVQVKGDGPIGQIIADANAKGEVRGYVKNPHVHLPSNSQGKLDVRGAVGTEGFIHVTKDLGLKEPYRGSVPLISGELGEDFTYYFAVSEQTPSAVGLGVLVDVDNSVIVAGGFIIQLLPGLSDSEIDSIEKAIGQLPPVTALLDQGLELEEMLRWIVKDVQILEEMDIVFSCNCSRERVERTLISLGKKELEELRDEGKETEVVCDFCNEPYLFTPEEIDQLIARTEK
ncbi:MULTISPECIES: Hsp33 family molecular chaperone HslO [Paenibacillus]|jgi:molecular chaperone Hsp33|uniref:33 kDa chaperonin n=2 Tax=Paenibacillus barengoltzii TaxID=343517 RepID=R9L4N2_9BACL|nr:MULTISPECIES: Hsp33 family molecular chaperone HslO [Paenibacillus]EOS53341.1 hsp33-like protein [Paenibacillus barengoltzii G22]MDU0330446.1 Hsp33 family molecular chaperone HslO [Paenibacillus sp. 3LSP]MEC2345688.1 Hsp33 family molecular chaperone HslO [Paenibacillus barengoltzii]SMF62057.1 molecular chaperone Hsp33 [Paenibacillus barengoltzii]SMF62894.1 molecular chaperone Hsp33 [Paenibacillus barengoltzii J12]